MGKYELLHQQLLYEGTCTDDNFFEPEIPNNKYLFMVHDAEYVSDLMNLTLDPKTARRIGFPLSEVLIEREMIITDGTIKASELAFHNGISMNIAGGTHHAFTNKGEGFCLFNDQAIGARYLQGKGLVKKILIVDLDVHQGNGTAEIFKDDSSVFTFSMHGKKNYPFIKEQSDLDIPLETGIQDQEYLAILNETLPKLIAEQKPEFIFYLSGVDIIESDKLGKLSLTLDGCKERDKIVLEACKNSNIPVMCSMGGGYSPNINTIVDAHANTFRMAQEIFF